MASSSGQSTGLLSRGMGDRGSRHLPNTFQGGREVMFRTVNARTVKAAKVRSLPLEPNFTMVSLKISSKARRELRRHSGEKSTDGSGGWL